MKMPSLLFALILLMPPNTARADDAENKTICLKHLDTLYRAIIAYKQDKGKLSYALSDLVPHYMNAKVLRCPAEEAFYRGRAKYDPSPNGSYSYEMRGEEFPGLSDPMGKFPPSDLPGKSWGSYRHVNLYQRTFFGDRVPMVRCPHHNAPQTAPDEAIVLNLTLEGKIYESTDDWMGTLPTVDVALGRAAAALKQGIATFEKTWDIQRLEHYAQDWMNLTHISDLRSRLKGCAELLITKAPQMQHPGSAYKLAGRLFYGAKEYATALAAIRKTQQTPEGQDHYTVTMLADTLIRLGRVEEVIPLYQKILDEDPGIRFYQVRMAEAYAALGQREKAAEWERKANLVRELIGKPAPDFALPDADGRTVSLAEALRGKKALLVNFWFIHCPACQQEFPHLEKMYTRFKDKGLGVVAINIVDDKAALKTYRKQKRWTIPLLRDQDGGTNHGVTSRYEAHMFPANYLIDAQGIVRWVSVGYDLDGMTKALKQAGFE